jgi:hypothetical protein
MSRKDAKAQRLAKTNCFVFIASLREILLLIFHSLRGAGGEGVPIRERNGYYATTPKERESDNKKQACQFPISDFQFLLFTSLAVRE